MIKRAITLLGSILVLSCSVKASLYYVSPNGSDSNDGTSPSTAWESLQKVNSMMSYFEAGDQILFQRGATYRGTLRIRTEGEPDLPVIFGAFGTGNLPVIKAAIVLNTWTSLGENIWSTNCTNCPDVINGLYRAGISMPLGRFPNSGYLTIDSHSGNTAFSDDDLINAPNCVGGEAVIRTQRWILDRAIIQNQTSNSISFVEGTNYEITDGFGYFLQNHRTTLDTEGS